MKSLKIICMALLVMVAVSSCGKGGNANVYSTRITVSSSQWQWDANNANWYVTIDYPDISSDAFDGGATLVYMDVNGSWSQLPLTYYYQFKNNMNEWIDCEASIEVLTSNDHSVTMRWTESDFYAENRPETHDFKIVVIEPLYAAQHPEVDYSDYESVKSTFQIND